jgi:hypothetical protein
VCDRHFVVFNRSFVMPGNKCVEGDRRFVTSNSRFVGCDRYSVVLNQGIANRLVAMGVPNQDIILAFHEPNVRQYTDFGDSEAMPSQSSVA